MNQVTLTTIDGLDRLDLLAICSRLTKAGSEFQVEVATVLDGAGSSCTPIAVWHCDGAMVGWACSHVWRAMQTLEQFVEDRYRNTGKATALTAVLLGAGVIDSRKPLAVFSPSTADIARKLGCAEVVLFQRAGSEWAEV
jgi:putative intracellular protease/amidase